jgi:ATP-dependent Clp protease ATP-binding subunit ClpC
MWHTFAEPARRAIFLAHEEAQLHQSTLVDTEHLLLGLIRDPNSRPNRMLLAMDCSLEEIRQAAEALMPESRAPIYQEISMSPRTKRVFDLAVDESRRANSEQVQPEHLLLGLLRDAGGHAADIFTEAGLFLDSARYALAGLPDETESPRSGHPMTESAQRVLDAAAKAAGADAIDLAHIAEAIANTGRAEREEIEAQLDAAADSLDEAAKALRSAKSAVS